MRSRGNPASTGVTLHSGAVSKPSKSSRKMTKADLKCTDQMGPKRSLNAWMGFRCFYLRILAGLPQKVISQIMTLWWSAELFGAKWTLLAKAYSIVRGSRLKKDCPLDGFFAICAPMVGVVPPNEYLMRNGWELGPPVAGDQEGMPQIKRLFVPTLSDFPPQFATTTTSVDDLVKRCYDLGFVQARSEDVPSTSAQGTLNMISMPTATPATAPFTEAAMPENDIDPSLQQSMQDQVTALGLSPVEYVVPSPSLTLPAAGQGILNEASELFDQNSNSYHATFDNEFDHFDYNPAARNNALEDDGRFDAYQPGPRDQFEQESQEPDWNFFVNQ